MDKGAPRVGGDRVKDRRQPTAAGGAWGSRNASAFWGHRASLRRAPPAVPWADQRAPPVRAGSTHERPARRQARRLAVADAALREDRHPNRPKPRSGFGERSGSGASRAVRRTRLAWLVASARRCRSSRQIASCGTPACSPSAAHRSYATGAGSAQAASRWWKPSISLMS